MEDSEIKRILQTYKNIAVLGLSPNPERPSYGVTRFMQSKGFKICGVRPGGIERILNEPCYESLADVPPPLEIVDVFRASENVPEIVDEVLKTDAKVLWLQEGVTHPEAEERARQAGLKVVSNRCILKEYKRLIGS